MKIFCIIGKIGSGKDAIRNILLRQDDLHLKILNTYVDREKRADEIEGVNHIYISHEEMDQKLLNENILFVEEWRNLNQKNKNRYMLLKPNDDGVYILTCSLQSYNKIKNRTDIDIIPIVIQASGEIRLHRSVNREGKYATSSSLIEICRRFISDEEDYSLAKLTDVGITSKQVFNNDGSITETIGKIRAYILKNTIKERRNSL